MRRTADASILAQTIIALALAVGAFAPWAEAQTDRACVTVGRTTKPPAIDGKIGADEWRDAAAVSGFLQVGEGAVAAPNTVAYIMYDDRALYVAVRCLEPDPARPRGFVRPHDDEVWADDCVQVLVAPEDLAKAGQAQINFGGYAGAYQNWYADIKAYYQFDVNCRGSVSEARNDVRDWDAPWEAKVTREPGAWTAEIAIPFRSLGLEKAPGDTLWGFNLFRNRPPDLSGWVCPGFGGYTPTPLGAMWLAAETPVARVVDAPTVPKLGTNSLAVEVNNPTGKPVRAQVTVTPSGGEKVTRAVDVAAGERAQVSVDYGLEGEGGLRARYEVTAEGEKTPLLSGFVPLSVSPKVTTELRYFALPGTAEGTVHLEAGHAAAQAILTAQVGAGEAATKRAGLAGTQGTRLEVHVAGQVGETVHTTLRVLDARGKVLAERVRDGIVPAKSVWLATHAGEMPTPHSVLPPWTPMKVSGKTVEVLGRKLSFGDLALPATIESAGAQMLAAPMRVVVAADGKPVVWKSRDCRVAEQAADHVKLASIWKSDKLDLQVTCNIEYDGFSWNEVSLVPHGKVSVDRVALEMPLRREIAKYAYEGCSQASHLMSPVGMERPVSASLWLGDESRGLAWQAESLEWVQAKDIARQVEVVPNGPTELWRTTLIDTPTALTAPYTAKFALTVTPTKPVSLRKSRIFHGADYHMADPHAAGELHIPAKGNFDAQQGTLELWVKPTFDTTEPYTNPERSVYNRTFLSLVSSANEAFMLYYNADDRSVRLVTNNGAGAYPIIVGGAAKLPPGQWSYVGLSWGDAVRLNVNGVMNEQKIRGTIGGDLSHGTLRFELGSFAVDDIRLSRHARPLIGVPTAPLAKDDDTTMLEPCESATAAKSGVLVEGKFGHGIGSSAESRIDQLAAEGKRIVIFHEDWSRYEGYPDLEQIPKLKRLADACHQHGMLFLVYFDQLMADAAPEWAGLKDDFMALPERMWYQRHDIEQNCYVSCVNGPYGDLLLDGIAKLADGAGIDGVYMDGTTVPWDCTNPTHPGCGEYLGDGTYLAHMPIRATREFMKRLRGIFAQRCEQGKSQGLFLDAHTGGAINVATQSFCDGYYDGETLARYKPGFRLSPATYAAGYMGKQFGFRGEFLPNRHSTDEALAIALIHDSAMRGQPAEVDLALGPYEDAATRFIGYWEKSGLYAVTPAEVLGSLYLKPKRALLVLGSQTEQASEVMVDLGALLKRLPAGAQVRDAMSGEAVPAPGGIVRMALPGREWRMLEVKGN